MAETQVQIPVNVWLKTIDLSQYEYLFSKYKTVGVWYSYYIFSPVVFMSCVVMMTAKAVA